MKNVQTMRPYAPGESLEDTPELGSMISYVAGKVSSSLTRNSNNAH